MPGEYAGDVSRIEGHIRRPLAKATMSVDALDPLGKESTLGLAQLPILPLGRSAAGGFLPSNAPTRYAQPEIAVLRPILRFRAA